MTSRTVSKTVSRRIDTDHGLYTSVMATKVVQVLRKEAEDDPAMLVVPRHGWRILCSACGRESGFYRDMVTVEEDAEGHRQHRCPGPWLLDPDDDRVYVSLLPQRSKPAWMRRNDGTGF